MKFANIGNYLFKNFYAFRLNLNINVLTFYLNYSNN